jgi:hypothetical protein
VEDTKRALEAKLEEAVEVTQKIQVEKQQSRVREDL